MKQGTFRGGRRRSIVLLLLAALVVLWVVLTFFSSPRPLSVTKFQLPKLTTALPASLRGGSGEGSSRKARHLKATPSPKKKSKTSKPKQHDESPVSTIQAGALFGNAGELWEETNRPKSSSGAILAYLAIISNEDFVDGALVLGRSLRNHSLLLRNRTADLAIIVTSGRISNTTKGRLHRDGTYDEIIEVPSLAVRAPGAYWKDTFDKIYMFNMTQYRKIVFMDADMICVRSMDELFFKSFGDPSFVGAIGFRGGSEGPYFQTGMMVIQPSVKMFSRIYARFEHGVPPLGQEYNHGMNGRDGVLLRDVFGDRFKIIDNKYSRNLNPRWQIPSDVIALHLRGKVKPWFDRRLPNTDPELGKKEFGFPYILYWQIYEEMHLDSADYQRALHGLPEPEPYGGTAHNSEDGVSPLTHVWMMRYSKKEYVQLRRDEDHRRRRLATSGLSFRVGKQNESCDDACVRTGAGSCNAAFFNASQLQDCDLLMKELKCTSCELGVYWRPHPGNDYPAVDYAKGKNVCKYNLLFDERSRPTCSARNESTGRFCPCARQASPS